MTTDAKKLFFRPAENNSVRKGQIYFEKGTRSNFIVLKLIIKFDLLPFLNIFKNFLLILKIRLLSIHFINNFKRFV